MIGAFIEVGPNRYAANPIGYVICEGGCWEWVGANTGTGYGQIWVDGKKVRAHRWMYEQNSGPVPECLVLDHLCRKRDCVNPDHLRIVTHRENILCGTGSSARNAAKTHCPKGHPLTSDNLVPYDLTRGRRGCMACSRARSHHRLPAPDEPTEEK